jgi:hypothetical protein
MLAHLKIIWQFHAYPVHQKVSRFFGPRYIGDNFFLGPNLVSFNRAVIPLWKKKLTLCKHHFPCNTLTHAINEDLLNIKRKGDPEVSYPLSYVRYHWNPEPVCDKSHFVSLFYLYWYLKKTLKSTWKKKYIPFPRLPLKIIGLRPSNRLCLSHDMKIIWQCHAHLVYQKVSL